MSGHARHVGPPVTQSDIAVGIMATSRAALSRIVGASCIEAMALNVTFFNRGVPSTLLEDTAFGLCLHVHAVPLVDDQCEFIHAMKKLRPNLGKCEKTPISSHPIKKPDIYIEEARRLRLRLNGLYNLYNTSG